MTATTAVTQAPEGSHPHLLARFADQDLRTAFFVARPGPYGKVDADLLGGLGVREDIAGRGNKHEGDAANAVLWLTAHRTSTVICSSPQVLSDDSLHRLARHVAAAGSRLLLACDHGHAAATAGRLGDPPVVPWEQALAALPPPEPDAPYVASTDPIEWDSRVGVPRSDWTVFRDDCRRLLPAERFEHVDRLYRETARRVLARPVEPTVDQVVDDLTADLDACGSLDDAVTVLRATQAGLFKRGWILGADLEKTVTRLCSPERSLPLSDSEWRLLRGYASPLRAAVCALNAAGVPNNDMIAVTVQDTSDDGPLMQSLPAPALPYLRAQRLARLADGAAQDSALVPIGTAAVSGVLRNARRDLGLRFANRLVGGAERNVRVRGQLGLYISDLRPAQDMR